MINVLLLFGGGGAEHEVSRVSSRFLKEQLSLLNQNLPPAENFKLLVAEYLSPQRWLLENIEGNVPSECFLNHKGELEFSQGRQANIKIDFTFPCMHGAPGETGEIQVVLEMAGIPYFGCDYETSLLCFNKIQTKLLLDNRKIPVVPFDFVDDISETSIKKAEHLFTEYQGLFIKSSHQGSSVGCHLVRDKNKLKEAIADSLKYSPYALLEKPIKARELEISAYFINGELKITQPGEIIIHSEFYDYSEKYSESSSAEIMEVAQLDSSIKEQVMNYAREAAKLFRIKDLTRIDFFLEGENIYLNELNTFPGLTPISMFPMMLKQNGDQFTELLRSSMQRALLNKSNN